jgi:sulfopropanediol 3-dehydrogenase
VAIIADASADAEIVAGDLVGQAEHGQPRPGCSRLTRPRAVRHAPRPRAHRHPARIGARCAGAAASGEVILCTSRDGAARNISGIISICVGRKLR